MAAESTFLQALAAERPLQIVGVINAYCALLAEKAGFRALYLSGAGVANAAFGLPDLGMTTLQDVVTEVRRIRAVSALPLLVDADTGWGDPGHTVRTLAEAGAAALHIEDQVEAKRCGHRPGKVLVSTQQNCERIAAAAAGKGELPIVIMARTDAYASEGLPATVARAKAYVDAGAEMIFIEALPSLAEFAQFTAALDVPVLANMTEFGQTPLYTLQEFEQAGLNMVLYPLTAFRVMSQAALNTYQTLRQSGTQQTLLSQMQTRAELYEMLNYEKFEQETDTQLAKRAGEGHDGE